MTLDIKTNTIRDEVAKEVKASLEKWLTERLEGMRSLERLQGLEVEEDLTDFAKRIALTYIVVYEPTENGTKVTLVPKSDLNITKED